MEVRIMTYGGTVVSITTPDRLGEIAEVTLGHDTLAAYEADAMATGALIGRCANRIANGRFTLDGVTYQLSTNAGHDHLHGGVRGFQRAVWSAEPFTRGSDAGVVLRYLSPDGEEGYPGTVPVRVTYTLTGRDELVIEYHATTDRATPVNLTQHSYFNLGGDGVSDILDHELTIAASSFTPMTARLIPTGEIQPVAGTPFDFTSPHPIGERIDADDEQLNYGGGYDHNFVLDRAGAGENLGFAARLHSPRSGRTLELFTTQPGMQLYSGNGLGLDTTGDEGPRFRPRGAVALETQHFPNAPNEPRFPSVILRPGELFSSRTVYRFSSE
jgi:aldose 1-epimerase